MEPEMEGMEGDEAIQVKSFGVEKGVKRVSIHIFRYDLFRYYQLEYQY